MEQIKFFYKSLWKKEYNKMKARRGRREAKEKINYINWAPIKITEPTSFLLKTLNVPWMQ
jgi:hypothetical protein